MASITFSSRTLTSSDKSRRYEQIELSQTKRVLIRAAISQVIIDIPKSAQFQLREAFLYLDGLGCKDLFVQGMRLVRLRHRSFAVVGFAVGFFRAQLPHLRFESFYPRHELAQRRVAAVVSAFGRILCRNISYAQRQEKETGDSKPHHTPALTSKFRAMRARSC